MDIAVIGAGGSVGRQISQLIVAERLLQCEERLVLVGNPKGPSARSVHGFAVDLADAYAEISPQIDVVLEPEEIRADLIVVACGATIPPDDATRRANRDALAERNLPVFEAYASALARGGRGSEIAICISNPNELAVAVFGKHLDRRRVIGMGSFLDSLRFRKEIALDLGIRRQRIHAFMVGEHGFNMVPLWSGVHIHGYDDDSLREVLGRIRRGHRTENFSGDVDRARGELMPLVAEGRVEEAYAMIDRFPPDVRTALKPFVTHFSGSKTVVGTARTTLELLRTITMGHDVLVSGQITLDGEAYGLRGTIGVPFVIGNRGVDRIFEIPMASDERTLLCDCARAVQEKLDRLL